MRKSLKHPWLLFVAVVTAFGLVVTFGENLAKVVAWLTDPFRGRQELERVATYLSIGRVRDAQVALSEAIASFRSGEPIPSRVRLAECLVDSFSGSEGWDSTEEDGRLALYDELGRLPSHSLKTDALILLRYRLPPSVGLPATYFEKHESELSSPLARMLAARESCTSDHAWSERMLEGVIREARERATCDLEVYAGAWLAHCYRSEGKWDSARDVIESAKHVFDPPGSCLRIDRSTIEARLRGERLVVSRHFSKNDEAKDERTALEGLAEEEERRPDSTLSGLAVAVNVRYWLALDSLETSDFKEGETDASRCIGICTGRMGTEIQNAYPYLCSMASVLWTRSRMRQGDFESQAILQELMKASDGLKRLRERRGGPFWPEEALSHILRAEVHHRHGERADAVRQLDEAREARYESLRLGGVFDFEEEWQRIRRLVFPNAECWIRSSEPPVGCCP